MTQPSWYTKLSTTVVSLVYITVKNLEMLLHGQNVQAPSRLNCNTRTKTVQQVYADFQTGCEAGKTAP